MPYGLERKLSPSGEKVENLFVKFFPGHIHDTVLQTVWPVSTYNIVRCVYLSPHSIELELNGFAGI